MGERRGWSRKSRLEGSWEAHAGVEESGKGMYFLFNFIYTHANVNYIKNY